MRRAGLVFSMEVWSVLTSRSFQIMLVAIPLVGLAVVLLSSLSQQGQSNPLRELFGAPESEDVTEGYVDQAGLIQRLPDWVSAERLQSFASTAEAAQALEQKAVEAYYILPVDYLETGRIILVKPDFNPIAGQSQARLFREVVRFNLLGGDALLFERLENPVEAQPTYLSEGPQRDPSSSLTFFIPYGVMLIFYVIIMGSASTMLSSVNTEKKTRMLEILLSSIQPVEIFAGKLAGLGVVGLLQTAVWGISGLGLMRLSGQALQLPESFQLPAQILAWGVVFFLVGYAQYAGLMGGIGALATNLKEASQVTTVVMLPMIIPLVLVNAIAGDPNGALAVTLSLLPFTAPTTMMARLATGWVPGWQIGFSAVIQALAAVLVVRAAAGLFRSQMLLSGQVFNLGLFVRALLGKA
jgi:ABC-2 type transport system permease protein